MIVEVTCDFCYKKFKLSKTLYNKRKKRNKFLYCSTNCSQKATRKREEIFCFKCGKKFFVLPSRIKNSKSGKNFCSKSCANSYNNTLRAKTSINIYRKKAFEYYEHKCAICNWNKDERILEVHHIDENRKNNNIENLIILCPICHKYLTLHIKTLKELKYFHID